MLRFMSHERKKEQQTESCICSLVLSRILWASLFCFGKHNSNVLSFGLSLACLACMSSIERFNCAYLMLQYDGNVVVFSLTFLSQYLYESRYYCKCSSCQPHSSSKYFYLDLSIPGSCLPVKMEWELDRRFDEASAVPDQLRGSWARRQSSQFTNKSMFQLSLMIMSSGEVIKRMRQAVTMSVLSGLNLRDGGEELGDPVSGASWDGLGIWLDCLLGLSDWEEETDLAEWIIVNYKTTNYSSLYANMFHITFWNHTKQFI